MADVRYSNKRTNNETCIAKRHADLMTLISHQICMPFLVS